MIAGRNHVKFDHWGLCHSTKTHPGRWSSFLMDQEWLQQHRYAHLTGKCNCNNAGVCHKLFEVLIESVISILLSFVKAVAWPLPNG